MSDDDIYEDELTTARKKREYEAGVADHQARLRDAVIQGASAEWNGFTREQMIEIADKACLMYAEEAVVAAERMSRITILENRLLALGHGLEIVPPHQLPDQRRVCYRGTLTVDEAQAKLGPKYRVLELRQATCAGDDDDLVSGTEVIFAKV